MVASLVAYVVDRHSFYDHLKMQYIHDVHHESIPTDSTADGEEVADNTLPLPTSRDGEENVDELKG
jgi:hypothetical protein